MKKCSKCGTTRSLSFFGKQKDSKDGLKYTCKLCIKKYRDENKESIAKWQKEYRANHKLERKAYDKDYRIKNKEYCSERTKKYKKLNEKNLKAFNKEYSAKYRSTQSGKRKARFCDLANRKIITIRHNYIKHHWCYADGCELDVLFLTRTEHQRLHHEMTLNCNDWCYYLNNTNKKLTKEDQIKMIETTQKGRLFIHDLLKKREILAVIEQEEK